MKKHKEQIQNVVWGRQQNQFNTHRVEIISKSATKDTAMAGWNPKRTSTYMITATMGDVGIGINIQNENKH